MSSSSPNASAFVSSDVSPGRTARAATSRSRRCARLRTTRCGANRARRRTGPRPATPERRFPARLLPRARGRPVNGTRIGTARGRARRTPPAHHRRSPGSAALRPSTQDYGESRGLVHRTRGGARAYPPATSRPLGGTDAYLVRPYLGDCGRRDVCPRCLRQQQQVEQQLDNGPGHHSGNHRAVGIDHRGGGRR